MLIRALIEEIIALIGVNGLKIIITEMSHGGETQKQLWVMYLSGVFLTDNW